MSNFASSKSVILKNVRAQWLDIYTAQAGKTSDGKPTEPKFKAVVLFEPTSEAATASKAGLLEAATALWRDNARGVLEGMNSNSKALRNGNGKIDDSGSVREEFKGMLYVSAANKSRPQVVGPRKHNGKWVTITEDGRGMVDGVDVTSELNWPVTVPYRGCYVNLKVQFVAGKSFKGDNGDIIPNQVYAKLEAVQFVKDGTAFGAGPTSAEGFGEEEVATSAAGGSDDGLF